MTPHLDIMLDLETLGVTPDAVILSLGACAFELETGRLHIGRTIYRRMDIDSQSRRHISGNTLAWWMGQSDTARAVFDCSASAPDQPVPARAALHDLAIWAGLTAKSLGVEPNGIRVWSNGADFDIPMLTHACHTYNINLPWGPYSARCYRTYKNLPGARDVSFYRSGTAHHALDDAIHQAQHLCAIHRALFGCAPVDQSTIDQEAA